MKYKLLSDGKINHKIKKNIKLGYNTYSLNFAHSDLSGYNVCPIANKLTEQENNPNKSNFPSLSPDTFSINKPTKEEITIHA